MYLVEIGQVFSNKTFKNTVYTESIIREIVNLWIQH
jgi:hypothetical protein